VKDEFFESPLEQRPFQENATVTSQTAQADISAETDDLPVEAAAGVGLAQAQYIA
jgi:hypothetical protein